MKTWFPFSDYDFYGYLCSGFFLLFSLDYALTGGTIMIRPEWTFVEIAFAVALAYCAGQVAAMPSSTLFEFGLARRLLHSPTTILLRMSEPRCRERFIARLVGRNYSPYPEATCRKLVQRAAEATGCTPEDVAGDAEAVFAPAFTYARTQQDSRDRLDGFRNQYGFSRNMAFVAFAASMAIGTRAILMPDPDAWLWALGALVLGLCMLCRFLKFYSAFAAEVLRAFAFSSIKSNL